MDSFGLIFCCRPDSPSHVGHTQYSLVHITSITLKLFLRHFRAPYAAVALVAQWYISKHRQGREMTSYSGLSNSRKMWFFAISGAFHVIKFFSIDMQVVVAHLSIS